MSPGLAPRWMLSFADLMLLLLGFFILLYASGSDVRAVTAGTRAAFSGAPAAAALLDVPAESLFEAGEARLRGAANTRLLAMARRSRSVVIESSGKDAGGNRFDSWELAAARTAAVARALQQGGVAEDKVRIVMVPERAGDRPAGQRLVLR